MNGQSTTVVRFMEGADKRFVIPVYQRKYDWNYSNCQQLFDDLMSIIANNRQSHFLGSIVTEVVTNSARIEYNIIDGQQRLTTFSLLLLAMKNLVEERKVDADEDLAKLINTTYLIDTWTKSPKDQIKLRLNEADMTAYSKLFGDKEEYVADSNVTANYNFLYDMILSSGVAMQDLLIAVKKLEIVQIALDENDNAQLIFESINSTGLDLTEGDKIRNYILMGLPVRQQTAYYNDYWKKIEEYTNNDVSNFVRNYLCIKDQSIPNINHVYFAFKTFAKRGEMSLQDLLVDMLKYAKLYSRLINCESKLGLGKLDDLLYRLKRLDIVVTYPFLMEVLRLNQEDKISSDDVYKVFSIVENYIFRRTICEVPTNMLNKIFLTLNRDILRLDGTSNDYVDKLSYILTSKIENSRFPNDEEFKTALANRQIFMMSGKNKAYIFERFENSGTVETKDVYAHLDKKLYSIEHIMPQTLSDKWKEDLGPNYQDIHEKWVHRLANLTLTGYNSELSNSPFDEKRDTPTWGYKNSGIRMNQMIAQEPSWGPDALQRREDRMVEKALTIWSYPRSSYSLREDGIRTYTLEDEEIIFRGSSITKYSYLGQDVNVKSWVDMLEGMLKLFYEEDKSKLVMVVYSGSISYLSHYINKDGEGYRKPLKIAGNIFIEANTDTLTKIKMLRAVFELYEKEPRDLVFYLQKKEKAN